MPGVAGRQRVDRLDARRRHGVDPLAVEPHHAGRAERHAGHRIAAAEHAGQRLFGRSVAEAREHRLREERMRALLRGGQDLRRIAAVAVEHARQVVLRRRFEQPLRARRPAGVGQHGVRLGHPLDRQPRGVGRIPLRLRRDGQALAVRVDQDARDLGPESREPAHPGHVDAFVRQQPQDFIPGLVVADAAPVDRPAAEPLHRDRRVGAHAAARLDEVAGRDLRRRQLHLVDEEDVVDGRGSADADHARGLVSVHGRVVAGWVFDRQARGARPAPRCAPPP